MEGELGIGGRQVYGRRRTLQEERQGGLKAFVEGHEFSTRGSFEFTRDRIHFGKRPEVEFSTTASGGTPEFRPGRRAEYRTGIEHDGEKQMVGASRRKPYRHSRRVIVGGYPKYHQSSESCTTGRYAGRFWRAVDHRRAGRHLWAVGPLEATVPVELSMTSRQ